MFLFLFPIVNFLLLFQILNSYVQCFPPLLHGSGNQYFRILWTVLPPVPNTSLYSTVECSSSCTQNSTKMYCGVFLLLYPILHTSVNCSPSCSQYSTLCTVDFYRSCSQYSSKLCSVPTAVLCIVKCSCPCSLYCEVFLPLFPVL